MTPPHDASARPSHQISREVLLQQIASGAAMLPAAVSTRDLLPIYIDTILSIWMRLELQEALDLITLASLLCRDGAITDFENLPVGGHA